MHNGQMVTTHQLKLCHKATPLACSMCFPERSSQEMFLRHHYVKTILESCDALISPSEFLIQRYRDCGIDHPRFYMLENGLPAHFSEERRPGYQQTYSPDLELGGKNLPATVSAGLYGFRVHRPAFCRKIRGELRRDP
jgi:hypothetical protein